MSDFKKKATPPEPTDDYSPSPALGLTFNTAPETPEVDKEQEEADKETNQWAAPRWHSAWDKVQEVFEDEIASRNPAGGANSHRELPADEFKIRMITDADVVAVLEGIMERIQSAVEQSEQQPKRKKQSQPGA